MMLESYGPDNVVRIERKLAGRIRVTVSIEEESAARDHNGRPLPLAGLPMIVSWSDAGIIANEAMEAVVTRLSEYKPDADR